MSEWGELLGVTSAQTLRFFFERLRDVTEQEDAPASELLYNASVLAHFATTSVASASDFPPTPASLSTVFDVYVLDQSQHADPALMEAAGAQCLLLTGFFGQQLRARHNIGWYASLGAQFFAAAARQTQRPAHARVMDAMAQHFALWQARQARLAIELREDALLLRPPRVH